MLRCLAVVLALLCSLGTAELGAQGIRESGTVTDRVIASSIPPLTLVDTLAFRLPPGPETVVGGGYHFEPVLQEEHEPGNFALGAVVGAVLVYVWIEQEPATRGPGIAFVPVGALIGGVLFWTIGIG